MPRARSARTGFVAGFAAAVCLLAVMWGVRSVVAPGAKTFTASCASADVTAVIWLDSEAVVATVEVADNQVDRDWQVRWKSYSGRAGSPLRRSPGTTVLTASEALGDTDDGTHRTVLVRPDGASDWCRLDLNVHRYW